MPASEYGSSSSRHLVMPTVHCLTRSISCQSTAYSSCSNVNLSFISFHEHSRGRLLFRPRRFTLRLQFFISLRQRTGSSRITNKIFYNTQHFAGNIKSSRVSREIYSCSIVRASIKASIGRADQRADEKNGKRSDTTVPMKKK